MSRNGVCFLSPVVGWRQFLGCVSSTLIVKETAATYLRNIVLRSTGLVTPSSACHLLRYVYRNGTPCDRPYTYLSRCHARSQPMIPRRDNCISGGPADPTHPFEANPSLFPLCILASLPSSRPFPYPPLPPVRQEVAAKSS